MTTLKILKTEKEYETAVEGAIEIFDAQPGSPDFDELKTLGSLIKDYEDKHYQIPFKNPAPFSPFSGSGSS